MATATTATSAVETMETTQDALAKPGGVRRSTQHSPRSRWKRKRLLAISRFSTCATSPEQRLLAQSGLAEYLCTLSTPPFNLMNRRMRTRMSGGVRGRAGNRSPYSI